MIDIVIPYLQERDDFDIRHTLRSIEKNCKFEYRITFVGDQPEWAINVLNIPHAKKINVRQHRCYDAIEKIKLACNTELFSESIIVWHDDQFLLRPLTKSWFSRNIAVCKYNSERGKHLRKYGSGFERNLYVPTMDFLEDKLDQVYNYETHLPRTYHRSFLKGVLEKSNAQYQRYLYASLYFNLRLGIMYRKPDNTLKEDKSIVVSFHGFESEYSYDNLCFGGIANACKRKLFLNYNDAGVKRNPDLKKYVAHKFSEKSQFEV